MSRRKCKLCGNVFEKQKPLQYVCSPKCALDYAIKEKCKKDAKTLNDRFKMLETKLKDKPYYDKKMEVEINAICRLIDKGCKCISCAGMGNQAGHFHSVGSNPSLRYNLHNIHIQDYNCNVARSSNKVKYTEGLIKTYGKSYQEYVEFELVRTYPKIDISKDQMKEFVKIARFFKNELIKENKTYTAEERIELRNQMNYNIGIYIK